MYGWLILIFGIRSVFCDLHLTVSFVSKCPDHSCVLLPEGHGKPDSHHHVGGAAIFRGENGQEIIPHLGKHRKPGGTAGRKHSRINSKQTADNCFVLQLKEENTFLLERSKHSPAADKQKNQTPSTGTYKQLQ